MNKIGIVILNYLSYKDTIDCILSIKHQNHKEWHLVIVDNFSDNNSFEVINSYCADDDKITVLKTNENVGFAKGNNAGILYLKSKNIFRILCINGDTILEDQNYLGLLASLEVPKNCAMIGTKILDKIGVNQNVELSIHSKNFKSWLYNKSRYSKFSFILKIIFQILFELQKKSNLITPLDSQKEIYELNLNNCMLHGAAIMFTENYLKDYCGFFPETFLYLEEDFLNLICQKLGFSQIYITNTYIKHKEDSSTNMLFKGNRIQENKYKEKLIKENQSLLKFSRNLKIEELKELMK